MKSYVVKSVSMIIMVVVLAACSGGSDDSGGSVNYGLDGDWRGNFDSPGDGLVKLTISIRNNNISQILINGNDVDVTASLNKVSDNIFGASLSNGHEGGFYVDSSKVHMVVLSDDLGFGVLEKNGSLAATYSASDIVGRWSGYSVEVNDSLDIVDTYNSSATVLDDYSYSGTDKSGDFTGSFVDFADTMVYSQMFGNFSSDSGANGPVMAFISPDKTFVGTAACDQFPALDQCTFSAWRKQ